MNGPVSQVSRRRALGLLAAGAACCARAAASAGRVIVATGSKEGPHAAVIDGIQQALGAQGVASSAFHLPADQAAFRQELSTGTGQCAIAVGIDGLRALLSAAGRIPLIATMTFRGDLGNLPELQGAENRLAGGVWLDLPVSSVAAGLLAAFPATTRLALIRKPSQPEVSERLPAGIVLKSVECRSAAEVLAVLRKLRGEVEFILCTPDSELYNKATVEALILASLEHRLPLVGYSASFVHAGAAVGVYPDFLEVGRQTAALCERVMNNAQGARDEHPRRTVTAVNERVLHLLGREYRPKSSDDVMVIR